MDDQTSKKGKPNLMQDDRFKVMFENPEFQVDRNADEYKMLAPVLSRLDKGKLKELKRKAQQSEVFVQADEEERNSSDDDLFSEKEDEEEEHDASSDDDDRVWAKDVKKQYRAIRKEQKQKGRAEENGVENGSDDDAEHKDDELKMVPLPTNEFKVKSLRTKINK